MEKTKSFAVMPKSTLIHALGRGLAVGMAGAFALGCGAAPTEDAGSESVSSSEDALTATLSGTVRDAQGRALSGVTLALNGRTQATATTGANGTFSFPLNVPGTSASWSLMPTRNGCTFNPSVVNLTITGNRVQNFTGTGASCNGAVAGPVTPPTPVITGVDPGPRPGVSGAGGAIPTLNAQELAFFTEALDVFSEVDSVSGLLPEEEGRGLGPTFNGNACSQCHAQPAVGGSSPSPTAPQRPGPNPQVELATLQGATNTVPPFITENGPIREARFPIATGGGVAGLFTIRGRTDAPGCNLAQPNFAAQIAANDIVFRIPTPVFGLGLIEATPDLVLEDNLAATSARRTSLGIAGRFNHSGNDGTITRFGWKAQNKSLVIFAGEAYNVEQGVSNEVFGNERAAVDGCVFNSNPEDKTNNGDIPDGDPEGNMATLSSDTVNFAAFMRLSAPPTPAPLSAAAAAGSTTFDSIGCNACHSRTLITGPSKFTGVSNLSYSPFSDIALHHMGSGLADRVPQGDAGSDEFRTAPLWGVGQRVFFLHDGRATNLTQAIAAHVSTGSEANAVVANFTALTTAQQNNVLAFLRSL